jgi:hypothetical protein
VLHWQARRRLEKEQARADQATRAALDAILAAAVSPKDAADLLGLPPLKLAKLRARSARGTAS